MTQTPVTGATSGLGREVAPASRWFTEVHKPAFAERRLLVFPHAGAGAHALNRLIGLAPDGTEILALCLPGRDARFAEPPETSLQEVLAATDQVVEALPRLPTTLFGCSIGALLAARVAAARPDSYRHLVVASQTPGEHTREALRARTEPELLRVLAGGGQTPAAVLADDDFRAAILGRLAADLRLGRAAEAGFGSLRLPIPITALGGLSDPLVPAGLLAGWADHTEDSCRVVLSSGGHFAFLEPRHGDMTRAALQIAVD